MTDINASNCKIATALALAERCSSSLSSKREISVKYQSTVDVSEGGNSVAKQDESRNEEETKDFNSQSIEQTHHFQCEQCDKDQLRVIQVLSQELRNLKHEHRKLMNDWEKASGEMQSMQLQNQALDNRVKELETSNHSLQNRVNESNAQLETAIEQSKNQLKVELSAQSRQQDKIAETSHISTGEVEQLKQQVAALEAQVCSEREQRSVYESSAKKLGNMVLDANRALLQERERCQALESVADIDGYRGFNKQNQSRAEPGSNHRKPWSQHFTRLNSVRSEQTPQRSSRAARRRSSSATTMGHQYEYSPVASQAGEAAAASRRRRLSTASAYYAGSATPRSQILQHEHNSTRRGSSAGKLGVSQQQRIARRSSM